MQKQAIVYREQWNTDFEGELSAPLAAVCQMIYCMSGDFQGKPEVYAPENAEELWIHFPEASIQCDDFLSDYGDCLASLCGIYTISIHGFCGFLEEGTLHLRRDENGLFQERRNLSGQYFDILSALWVRIDFQRKAQADFVQQVVSAMDLEEKAAAVAGRWADVFCEKGLFENTGMTYYRYLLFDECKSKGKSMTASLSAVQLKELWIRYLRDQDDLLEFELIFEHLNEYTEAQLGRLMTGLRLAMGQLGVKTDYSGGEFRVVDGEGNRLWMSFTAREAAEKLFLKLLVPAAPGFSIPRSAAAS